jgi:hypothetical protein
MEELEVIHAPKALGIEADRIDATLEFLAQIRACSGTTREIVVNLANLEEISRSACVMLAAELENCARRCPRKVSGIHPTLPDARNSLDAFGVYQLLNVPSPVDRRLTKKLRRTVVLIKAGHDGAEDYLDKLADIKKAASRLFLNPLFADDVLVALDEAIININRHAYQSLNDGPESRLWLAGVVDHETNALLFYALDHGVGIPKRAPETMQGALGEYWKENPLTQPGDPSAREILAGAILASRAGVGLKGRGQGLPTMVGLVKDKSKSGAMLILSGGAAFRFDKHDPEGPQRGIEQRSYDLKRNFHGTLVVWRISEPIDGYGTQSS